MYFVCRYGCIWETCIIARCTNHTFFFVLVDIFVIRTVSLKIISTFTFWKKEFIYYERKIFLGKRNKIVERTVFTHFRYRIARHLPEFIFTYTKGKKLIQFYIFLRLLRTTSNIYRVFHK